MIDDDQQNKDPLKDWVQTTLWLQVMPTPHEPGPRIELKVWHPPDISDKERVALLAKHASQGVRVIWQLRGKTPNELIIQGQYQSGPEKNPA